MFRSYQPILIRSYWNMANRKRDPTRCSHHRPRCTCQSFSIHWHYIYSGSCLHSHNGGCWCLFARCSKVPSNTNVPILTLFCILCTLAFGFSFHNGHVWDFSCDVQGSFPKQWGSFFSWTGCFYTCLGCLCLLLHGILHLVCGGSLFSVFWLIT